VRALSAAHALCFHASVPRWPLTLLLRACAGSGTSPNVTQSFVVPRGGAPQTPPAYPVSYAVSNGTTAVTASYRQQTGLLSWWVPAAL
jgi:hypothetical protein